MSEYTREEILKLIEENGGPEGLDLSGKDLSGIDLSDKGIRMELAEEWTTVADKRPIWFSTLTKGIFLGGVDLQGANLRRANLQRANLWQANLREANLRGANLKETSLWEAQLHGANLYLARLKNTQLTRKSIGRMVGEEAKKDYIEAREVYLTLKNNFNQIGRYGDASWAYVKERQMGKMMHHPRLARKYYGEGLPENPNVWQLGWFYIRHTTKWALDWVVEWTCGYGESVLRTLRAMGVALVGFAILYWLLGAVVDANGNPSSTWLHCLLYSGGAFTTFGVDTLRPANDWIRALSIFESVVGIALTGLLGFVLGNRIRRS